MEHPQGALPLRRRLWRHLVRCSAVEDLVAAVASTYDVHQVGLDGFVDHVAVRVALDDAVGSGQRLFVGQQQAALVFVLHHRGLPVGLRRHHTVALAREEYLNNIFNNNNNNNNNNKK